MGDGLAQGFVLTLHLTGDDLTAEAADLVLHDLAHLSAVRAPTLPGTLLLHCTVSALSEADAVRYAAQRSITAMLGAGVDRPQVVSIETSRFDAMV